MFHLKKLFVICFVGLATLLLVSCQREKEIGVTNKFIRVNLPHGLSLELPPQWKMLVSGKAQTVRLIAKKGFSVDSKSERGNLFIVVKSNTGTKPLLISIDPFFGFDQIFLASASPELIQKIKYPIRYRIAKGEQSTGIKLKEIETPRVELIQGGLALATNATCTFGDNAVVYTLVHYVIPVPNQYAFTINMSYKSAEAETLKPVLERIRDSMRLT